MGIRATFQIGLAVLALGTVLAGPSLAQTPAVPRAAAAPTVVSYYPSFLDRIRAQTALEVIRRLPDFVYEEGGRDVGLDRNLGNVLINGKRANVDGITLSETLRRIPTGQVERIDIVRGAAPGVDMQGRTVVANVIVGDSITFKGQWLVTTLALPGKRIGQTGRLEGQRRQGQQVLDFSLAADNLPALGAYGSRERLRPDGTVSSSNWSQSASRSRQLEVRAGYDDRKLGGRVRVNLTQMQGDNANRSADESLLTGQRSESQRSSANGRQEAIVRYNRNDKTADLEASLLYQGSDNRNTTAGTSGSSSDSQRTDAALRYVRRVGARLDIESRLQQRENASENRSESNGGANVFYSNRESGERIGGVAVRHRRTPTLTLEAGLDGNQTWQSGSSRFTTPTTASAPEYTVEAERSRYEAYVNSIWKPDAKLTLEGGVRLENAVVETSGSMVSRRAFSLLRPRLALTWNPDRQTQATINIDREVDPVSLDNFISSLRRFEIEDIDEDRNESDKDRVIAGASALNPETRMVLRARYQKKWGSLGLFAVTAIHTELDDIVDRVLVPKSPTTVQEAPGNIGDGRREQVNVVLDYPLTPLGLDETLVRVQATWRETEVVDPVTGETRPMSGQAPFEWEARLSQDFKDGRLKVGVDVTGGSESTSWRPYEVSTTDREAKVLVYTEYRARPDMIMRAEVRNITDQETRSSREVWGTGARLDGIVSYREDRATRNGAAIYARLQRTY